MKSQLIKFAEKSVIKILTKSHGIGKKITLQRSDVPYSPVRNKNLIVK